MANVPPVIIQHLKFRILGNPDWVQVTGNGFLPINQTLFISFFYPTFGDAIFPDKAVLKNKKLLKENATKLINQIYDIN